MSVFLGCRVCATGAVGMSIANIKKAMRKGRGEFEEEPSYFTTHFLTTDKELDEKPLYAAAAMHIYDEDKSLKIVSIEWLKTSVKYGQKADETEFILYPNPDKPRTASMSYLEIDNNMEELHIQDKEEPVVAKEKTKQTFRNEGSKKLWRTAFRAGAQRITESRLEAIANAHASIVTSASNSNPFPRNPRFPTNDSPDYRMTITQMRKHSGVPVTLDPSDDDYDIAQPPANKNKDSQIAKHKTLRVPIDDARSCPGWKPYIGDDGTIYDCTLIRGTRTTHNSRYFRMQIIESTQGMLMTWTRWGRYGFVGQIRQSGDGSFEDALAIFRREFEQMTGLRWENRLDTDPMETDEPYFRFVQRNYEDFPTDIVYKYFVQGTSVLPESVQQVMQFIFNEELFAKTMKSMDYDAEQLPLGQIGEDVINHGFKLLREIEDLLINHRLRWLVDGPVLEKAVADRSRDYYTTIPHTFGHRPAPVMDMQMLSYEIGLLESLYYMQIAKKIMEDNGGQAIIGGINPLDRQFAALGLKEMVPMEKYWTEYQAIADLVRMAAEPSHRLLIDVQEIFRVRRRGERERFAISQFGSYKNSDRRLLWFGTRAANLGAVLSRGLRISTFDLPEIAEPFGKGLYLVDISSTSIEACHWAGTDGTAFLLLCEVELGSSLALHPAIADPFPAAQAAQHGCNSVVGLGRRGHKRWRYATELLDGPVRKTSYLGGAKMSDNRLPAIDTFPASKWEYNKYCALTEAQVLIRYVLQLKVDHPI